MLVDFHELLGAACVVPWRNNLFFTALIATPCLGFQSPLVFFEATQRPLEGIAEMSDPFLQTSSSSSKRMSLHLLGFFCAAQNSVAFLGPWPQECPSTQSRDARRKLLEHPSFPGTPNVCLVPLVRVDAIRSIALVWFETSCSLPDFARKSEQCQEPSL